MIFSYEIGLFNSESTVDSFSVVLVVNEMFVYDILCTALVVLYTAFDILYSA